MNNAYATFDLAQRRVEVLKQQGIWPGIRTRADGAYELTYDPEGRRDEAGTANTAAKGDKPVKLYVWTKVLWDYSSGMIVALAPDMETALQMARESDSAGAPGDMGSTAPDVIDLGSCGEVEPKFWYVHGGS